MTGSVFDAVAEVYDRARPSYPDEIFDALQTQTGTLAGQVVLDGGAGTGIASRQLAARGARVIPFDIGEQMLRRCRARAPRLPAVVADGTRLPFLPGRADLICFAQSWHWFDSDLAGRESARVLRAGGHWAAWWNHAWADDEEWFHVYLRAVETHCPAFRRDHRGTRAPDRDRAAEWSREQLALTGLFEAGIPIGVPWTRVVSAERWLAEERSKSYVAVLSERSRMRLLAEIAAIVTRRFPDGTLTVPYWTLGWVARKR